MASQTLWLLPLLLLLLVQVLLPVLCPELCLVHETSLPLPLTLRATLLLLVWLEAMYSDLILLLLLLLLCWGVVRRCRLQAALAVEVLLERALHALTEMQRHAWDRALCTRHVL